MRWHGARRRRGSSWPTTHLDAAPPAGARRLVERERADLLFEQPGCQPPALAVRRVGRQRAATTQAADDQEDAHREAARRDARERSEQGDRQHGATVEAAAVGQGSEQAGKGRAIRAYVRANR